MSERDSFCLIPVEREETTEELAMMAESIWTEYYTPLIGEKQVRYMLENIQSKPAILRQIRDERYLYFFLHDQGERVGYLSVLFSEDRRCFLSKIYLVKEMRRRGYAGRALQRIEAMCVEKNIDTIWLTVNIHNEDSISAYENLGFVVTEKKCADIGGGFVMDDFIMEKKIV